MFCFSKPGLRTALVALLEKNRTPSILRSLPHFRVRVIFEHILERPQGVRIA